MNAKAPQTVSSQGGLRDVRQWSQRAAPQPCPAGERYDVSVVIVNWNTRDLLRNCLHSLCTQAGAVRFETIVIDNASSDRSAAMVAVEFPWARLIRNAHNRGFAAANNQGINIASGRYVLLLNPDTLILDGAIAKAVRFADMHPEAAVVGVRAFYGDGGLQENCFMFPSLLNLLLSLSQLSTLFAGNRLFGRARMTWWDYDAPRVVDVVAGFFMLVRRRAIEDVGLMDESYFMYSEETDWCWRFGCKGWKTMYTPEASIVHFRDGSTSQCVADMHVLHRKSWLLFLEKKSGKAARRTANAMFAIAAMMRLAVVALGWLRGGASRAAAVQRWRLCWAALRFHIVGSVASME